MNEQIISDLLLSHLQAIPQHITRCAIGIANEVYIIDCAQKKYVFRCSTEENAYADTIYWLEKLTALDLPIPRVLFSGKWESWSYLILDYIEGEDIGLVYPSLSKAEKRQIAKDVMAIQRKVAELVPEVEENWSWFSFIDEMLDRAEARITQNGYFDPRKVMHIREQIPYLQQYFSSISPTAYFDDISTKNLLIHNGKVSGVIDIDWMGYGDRLTFIAMTYVALVNMGCETDYIDYLLEESVCSEIEKTAFLFYCLLYCVDFMGERGMQFGDKRVAVSDEIVARFNKMFDDLWEKWCMCKID